jgi:hypothetical protein
MRGVAEGEKKCSVQHHSLAARLHGFGPDGNFFYRTPATAISERGVKRSDEYMRRMLDENIIMILWRVACLSQRLLRVQK